MNKKRRELITKSESMLHSVADLLARVESEESEALCNMPENLQESERCLNMEENVDVIYQAISYIEEAINCFDDIK